MILVGSRACGGASLRIWSVFLDDFDLDLVTAERVLALADAGLRVQAIRRLNGGTTVRFSTCGLETVVRSW